MPQLTLEIDGMSCSHCVRAVDQALRDVPGVTEASVQIGSATVTSDPTVTLEQLLDAVADAGYSASASSVGRNA